MSYIKIMIHCVWSTKYRFPYLIDKEKRYQLFTHILDNAREKNIFIDNIGGEKEHVHCLLSLGKKQNTATVLQLIKGESACWFNKQFQTSLQWQDDYFAVSVGESQLPLIRNYIQKQEEHHKKKSFSDEYKEFIDKYRFIETDKQLINTTP